MSEDLKPNEPPKDASSERSPLELELEEVKTRLQYTLAEMENMRKRLVQDKQEMINFAVENVILEFLEPIDNFENALGFTDKMSEETRTWCVGFQMILGQLKSVLNRLGVTAFHSVGRQFDPTLHHAMEVEATDKAAPGTIIQELQKGFSHRGKTLRHARVKVAKALEATPVTQETKES